MRPFNVSLMRGAESLVAQQPGDFLNISVLSIQPRFLAACRNAAITSLVSNRSSEACPPSVAVFVAGFGCGLGSCLTVPVSLPPRRHRHQTASGPLAVTSSTSWACRSSWPCSSFLSWRPRCDFLGVGMVVQLEETLEDSHGGRVR